jgi:hypothetical protein
MKNQAGTVGHLVFDLLKKFHATIRVLNFKLWAEAIIAVGDFKRGIHGNS